jgi:hypothetical protein
MPSFEYVRVSHNSSREGTEWRVTTIGYFTDGSSVEFEDRDHALATLGKDGWELVTATLTSHEAWMFGSLYFKRQVGD